MNAYYQIEHGLAARKDLRPVDKLIFGIIRDHIGNNSNGWPGLTCLQREAAVSRHTVIDSIRRLEMVGVLQVLRQGPGKRTRYMLPGVVQEAHQSSAEPAPVKVVQKAHHSGAEPAPDQCRKRTASGAEPAHEPPNKPPQEPPQEPKPPKKARPRNEYSDGFVAAYEAHFEEKYQPSKDESKGDFVQLAAMLKRRSDITPARFVEVAEILWGQHRFTPSLSMTIRGLASGWGKLAGKANNIKKTPKTAREARDGPADHANGF